MSATDRPDPGSYDIEVEILAATRKPHSCEYGLFSLRCGADAWTSRLRPGGHYWWVCARHGAFLDRLRERMEHDARLLARLESGETT